MRYPFLCLVSLSLFASPPVEQQVRKVRAHLTIEDPISALHEAERLSSLYPDSMAAQEAYIEALAAAGREKEALAAWKRAARQFPSLAESRPLMEEVSWSVLYSGAQSTQYAVRLASLVGAYLTQDARAIPLFIKGMRDSNAVLRTVAIQLASHFRDAPLRDEVARLMGEEKVWMVRLDVVRAAGLLGMKEFLPLIEKQIESKQTPYEEREIAVEAYLALQEEMAFPQWEALAKSERAGLRYLACSIAAHFEMKEAKEGIFALLSDPHPSVRIAALNAFGLYYRKLVKKAKAKELLQDLLEDPNAAVAITAAWASLLVDPPTGETYLAGWLEDALPENRRLAAGAVAQAGKRGVRLAKAGLKKAKDPYVRANLAIGLIGQRTNVSASADVLASFLESEKRPWMWDTQHNPLFQVLAPSRIRYVDHIPNYPEAIDQMTRLNLVSLLAILGDPRAEPALKGFLQNKTWGITGVAAATLLQEGDESALSLVRALLDDKDPNVRLQAALVLAMFGRDEDLAERLQAAYKQADHEKKLHILEALGRVATQENFAFLLETLQEPFPILRVAAAASLIQSLNR